MKKVLVTGATGSIGEAIVKYFANNEYFVYIHYNSNEAKAKEILQSITNGEIIKFNATSKEEIKASLEGIEVDVLVNNLGIIKDGLFFFMDDNDWESVLNTNLNSLYYVTKAILPSMMSNKKGSIVNISSISGLVGNVGQVNYSTTKGGIFSFTKALCLEVGRYNIRVNSVAPGIIESEMTKDLDKGMKNQIPCKRFGTPDEVAEVVFFLGDKGTYINGEIINVSGGMVR